MKERKSLVRVVVTYCAAFFLFFAGPGFIIFLIWTGQRAEAINLFGTILPVSAAIVSFWFAGRAGGSQHQGDQTQPRRRTHTDDEEPEEGHTPVNAT